MGRQEDLADAIASFAIFADLTTPQLRALALAFEEVAFPDGERVLRQGLSGAGFYVIVEGEALVSVNNEDRTRLRPGDFFGDVSILLGEPPTADVTAVGDLRCLVLAGERLQEILEMYPKVMYRMLQAGARRLRQANQWRS